MSVQFNSNEKWRQLGDDPVITNYIKEFGEKVYEKQYLPGRIKYGHDLLGDPFDNLAEEIGDTVSYLAMAKQQQLEFVQQITASRKLLKEIMYIVQVYPSTYTSLIQTMITKHLSDYVDVSATYPTD